MNAATSAIVVPNLKRLSKNILRETVSHTTGDRMSALQTSTAPLESMSEYIEAVARLWEDTQQRFIAIGRHLLHAKKTLAHGEWEVMITSRLPFSRSVAHYLRAVAESLDAGRLSEAELPVSYATAYKLTSLTNDDLDRARQIGIVRPDVTRAEVDAFRKSLRVSPNEDPNRASLIVEKTKLERLVSDSLRRIAEIDSNLLSFSQPSNSLKRPVGRVFEGTIISDEVPKRARR